MSKTTQYLLGTLAIVGGSLYVYEQRAQSAVIDHQKLQEGKQAVVEKAQELKAIGENKADKISQDLSDLKGKANAKVNEASDYVVQQLEQIKKDTEKTAKSWWGWGASKGEEAKKKAADEYENAKNEWEKAKKEANEQSQSWISWSKDKTEEAKSKSKAKLSEAEAKLKKAQENLKATGHELYEQYTKEIPFANDKKLAERSLSTLRGWGDSAAVFAQEELDLIDNYKNKPVGEVNWSDEIFTKSHELSRYAQEQSQKKYDDLKAQLDAAKKETGGWFSKKNEEAEKKSADLQKQLDQATVEWEKAKRNAQDWGIKAVNDAADSLQSGLDQAKDWVNEKKK